MKKFLIIIVFLACLLAGLFSAWKLYGYYRIYHDGKKEYDKLTDHIDRNEFDNRKDDHNDKEGNKKAKCPIKVDFDALRKINPDVVGWIYIPDTEINYPIVQAKDNSTYLHKTFRGKDSYVGAIFLDAFCKPDFSSFNSIIYGHNLKNGEMFGHLKKLYDVEYNGKADYKKHPKIWIITPDDAYEYTIFAFREISVKNDKDVYTVDQSVSKERRKFLDGQIRKSQKKTRMSPSENRRMITLSTCTSHTEDGRFVVQAGNID